jgi:hypothetical protein
MLDFLFQLGQLLSLLGLASGLFLTIRYRNWAHEADTKSRTTQIDLLPARNRSNESAAASPECDARAGHRETVAA